MKKMFMLLLATAVVSTFAIQHAIAIPAFKKAFDKRVTSVSKNAGLVAAAKEAKCNVCHFGKSKKMKNDFGKALATLLKKANYKSTRIQAEPEKVKAEFDAAFKKVWAMKNPKGVVYGTFIKDGKLPGTITE